MRVSALRHAAAIAVSAAVTAGGAAAACGHVDAGSCTAATCEAAIASALAACNATGGGVVSLSPGVFRFADTGGGGFVVVMDKMVGVGLAGAPLDPTTGAPTTTLQIDGIRGAGSLDSATSVRLSNVAVALTRVPVTLGTAVDVGDHYVTISVANSTLFPFPASGDGSDQPQQQRWLYGVAAVSGFDLGTWRMEQNGVDYYGQKGLTVQLPTSEQCVYFLRACGTMVRTGHTRYCAPHHSGRLPVHLPCRFGGCEGGPNM